MKKKDKTKLKKIAVMSMILLVVLSIVGTSFLAITQSDKDKYVDENVLQTSDGVMLEYVPTVYTGNQLTWGYLKDFVTILPVYGSIRTTRPICGNSPSVDIYKVRTGDNYYCQELGHTGAYAGTSGPNKVSVFDYDYEGCDSTTPDYPKDCTYWREESYDLYPRTSISCYDAGNYKTFGTRIYVEPITLDGYYDTFEVEYSSELNGQTLDPFIEINDTAYYFSDYPDNKIEFDHLIPINTKIYYAIDFSGDGSATPFLKSDLVIVPSVSSGAVDDLINTPNKIGWDNIIIGFGLLIVLAGVVFIILKKRK